VYRKPNERGDNPSGVWSLKGTFLRVVPVHTPVSNHCGSFKFASHFTSPMRLARASRGVPSFNQVQRPGSFSGSDGN